MKYFLAVLFALTGLVLFLPHIHLTYALYSNGSMSLAFAVITFFKPVLWATLCFFAAFIAMQSSKNLTMLWKRAIIGGMIVSAMATLLEIASIKTSGFSILGPYVMQKYQLVAFSVLPFAIALLILNCFPRSLSND